MFNEIIENYKNLIVYKDGIRYENIEGVDKAFNELLENSYFTSSLAIAEHRVIMEQKDKGVWIELDYGEERKYRESRFEKIIISIKPKYDYINLYRYYNKEYQGRCFGLSLGIKTTALYNAILGGISSGQ